MEQIKLSNYFELVHPVYSYIQIIPHKSIRNYNSSNIVKTISNTYKSINQRIHKEQKKLFFETNFKISYIIDISLDDVKFYFIIPNVYKSLIVDKIIEIWKRVTIKELDNIEDFSTNYSTYSMSYKKDDALSLNVDKKTNEPLNTTLNVLEVMQKGDKIRIAYNFLPVTQRGWHERYQEMQDKLRLNKPLEKKITSFDFMIKTCIRTVMIVLDSILEVLQDFTGTESSKDGVSLYQSVMNIIGQQNELSLSTKRKKDATIVNTQIAVMSSSENSTRQINNALSVCHSYNVLSEDNELISKKVNHGININDYDFKIDSNMCSSDECQNFIQIPANTLLKDYHINHIENLETSIPTELQAGAWCIGVTTCRGQSTNAYLSTDWHFRNLPLCVIAPNRAGKTTLLKNLSKDSIANGECSIIFDFCGECEFSNDVVKIIPKSQQMVIDCSDFNNLQGMGFNELYTDSLNPFEKYKSAKMQTSMLTSFINSINIDNQLEPRMNRYLKASSLVTFLSNGSISDVFEVLQNHIIRKSFIDKIPENQRLNMQEYILTLHELDEYSKSSTPVVIGTRISYIQSILNRLDIIKSNSYMELMLKKDCSENINLIKEIQKNQLICLKMPESMFSTEEEKDVYCTYWINKIWGALQQRHAVIVEKSRTKVNLFVDELYQVPCCQTFLKTKLNQIAKKTAKIVISCHSLEQIKYIRPELKNASTSYMLISGCSKDNFYELKEELEPFELDDLLSLKRYYSLNMVKVGDGYSKFITELPNIL